MKKDARQIVTDLGDYVERPYMADLCLTATGGA